jgi:DNA-binding CsgD family transcriptional regulator
MHPVGIHVDEASPIPLQSFRRSEPAPYRLTPQETRLLALLIQGHHKKTAADVMGISVNTVSFHLKNIYARLQVHSKTEAVVRVLQEGLLVSALPDSDPGQRRCSNQKVVPETALYNHARANFHSRSTVARDTCSVSAISSIVRPPKNLRSTI